MLQESLESPIASLQLEDPHLHREHANDKLSILDISATLDTGTKVNVEIQLNNNHDMMKRSLSTLTGSKTPPQNSAEAKKLGGESTARKSPIVQLIISGDEQNPTD